MTIRRLLGKWRTAHPTSRMKFPLLCTRVTNNDVRYLESTVFELDSVRIVECFVEIEDCRSF